MIPVLAMSLAGGLGAAVRFVVDGTVAARWHRSVPAGTAANPSVLSQNNKGRLSLPL